MPTLLGMLIKALNLAFHRSPPDTEAQAQLLDMENGQQPLHPMQPLPPDQNGGQQFSQSQNGVTPQQYPASGMSGQPNYSQAQPQGQPSEYDFIRNTMLPGQQVPGDPNVPTAAAPSYMANKKPLFIGAGAFLVFLLVVALITAATAHKKTPQASSLSCAPISANSANKTDAEKEFKIFGLAIKDKNQACADSLSSSYFKEYQSEAIAGSNGKWITKSVGGLPSLATRLAKFPSTLTNSDFTSVSYRRAETTDVTGKPITSSTDLPTGLTIGYPITDAYTQAKTSLEVSFVSAGGKLVVDYMLLGSPNIPSGGSSTNQSATNDSNTSGSSTATDQQQIVIGTATGEVFMISTYLEDYYGINESYPDNINPSTFTTYGVSIDASNFIPPSGVTFRYSSIPSGCTSQSFTCQHFTLSAINDTNNSLIYNVSSAN